MCFINEVRTVVVGSWNPVKVSAVKSVFNRYAIDAKVTHLGVPSGVSEQPTSLGETIEGAQNRAKGAYKQGCDLGIGIESGLMSVPQTKTGVMDTSVCVIYDGKDFHLGISSCFECPPEAIKLVREKGYTLDQACHELGITSVSKAGYDKGIIHVLTLEMRTRKEYTEECIMNALIPLLNPLLFGLK